MALGTVVFSTADPSELASGSSATIVKWGRGLICWDHKGPRFLSYDLNTLVVSGISASPGFSNASAFVPDGRHIRGVAASASSVWFLLDPHTATLTIQPTSGSLAAGVAATQKGIFLRVNSGVFDVYSPDVFGLRVHTITLSDVVTGQGSVFDIFDKWMIYGHNTNQFGIWDITTGRLCAQFTSPTNFATGDGVKVFGDHILFASAGADTYYWISMV